MNDCKCKEAFNNQGRRRLQYQQQQRELVEPLQLPQATKTSHNKRQHETKTKEEQQEKVHEEVDEQIQNIAKEFVLSSDSCYEAKTSQRRCTSLACSSQKTPWNPPFPPDSCSVGCFSLLLPRLVKACSEPWRESLEKMNSQTLWGHLQSQVK